MERNRQQEETRGKIVLFWLGFALSDKVQAIKPEILVYYEGFIYLFFCL